MQDTDVGGVLCNTPCLVGETSSDGDWQFASVCNCHNVANGSWLIPGEFLMVVIVQR